MSSGGTDDPKTALRSRREWTRERSNGGGAQAGNAMRGGTHGFCFGRGREGFRPSEERSEGETKATAADIPELRQREGGAHGNTPRTRPATAKGRGGMRERPTTRYRARRRNDDVPTSTTPLKTAQVRSTPREPTRPSGRESPPGTTL